VDGAFHLSTYQALTYKNCRASRRFSKLMPMKNPKILDIQKLSAVGIVNNFRHAGNARLRRFNSGASPSIAFGYESGVCASKSSNAF
jgi:hypothetical protein